MVAQHGGIKELGVGAVGAVPGVATVSPGQVEGERGEEVVERPGDDDIVVEADVQGDEDDSVANAWAGAEGSGRGSPRRPRSQLCWGAGSTLHTTHPYASPFL